MWTSSENQITIVLLRHGKTKGNEEHRYIGRTDEPLSEYGIRELWQQKKTGGIPDVDCLYESPMQRCRMTGNLLYPGKIPVIVPEFAEIDFGVFEGKNYEELRENVSYQRWLESGGTIPFPEGESREDFIMRQVRGFEKVWNHICEREREERAKRIGIIAHGGTIMALLSHYLGGEYFSYQSENGTGYIGKVYGKKDNPRFFDVRKIKKTNNEEKTE